MMIDRILLNGRIYTQTPDRPWATALAIRGERIAAVSSDDEIRALKGANTLVDNLEGRLVIPGLTDAHVHWSGYARSLQAVDLMNVKSMDEALARVAAKVKEIPPGEWVYGRGWRKDDLGSGEFPTAAHLDRVAPDHPVYLSARSGHAAWVNTKALQLAGLDAYRPNPPGGEIHRLPSGNPSGILLEDPAMDLVSAHILKPTAEQYAGWMRPAQEKTLRMGLTGIHDYDNPVCMEALQILREQGELKQRFVKQINDPFIQHAYELGVRSGFGDDWLRIGGLKIFADGALGPQTALMIEPYEGTRDQYGIAVTDKEEMYELVSQASARGLLSTIHAIGDRAVHDVLDVFETVRQEEAARGDQHVMLRHRIEHVQIIHPEDVPRLAALNVIASMQPIHATSDYQLADRYWGPRAEYSYAWRKQLEAGAVLAFGSDAPVEDIDPIAGIHAAVTRQRADGTPGPEGWYPQERLSLAEALAAYTMGAAFAAGLEDRLGQLAPGFLADLVVLDRDLFTIAPTEILEIQVLGTMVGGAWGFREF
ncbi:MAG: amidohydrolase [Chloroflexi bacterium]|nr:amidohydrolase [Chloroflexota bacterium]